jgi:hypothetical protein
MSNSLNDYKNKNILIADFMGYSKMAYRDGTFEYIIPEHDSHDGGNTFFPDCMYYTTSWDWIMPVIAKIKGEQYNSEGGKLLNKIIIACGEINLRGTYMAVVSFINWYNTTNKDKPHE